MAGTRPHSRVSGLPRMPGVIFKEMSQPDACCGSGGSCMPTHSETSASMAARKAADSDRTGRDGEATDVSAF
jgi:glycolate oxidase iron-sulfur subunit